MVADFLATNECFSTSEMRGYKLHRSCNEKYGDSAVGYVRIKRDSTLSIIRGRITPEHRVRAKPYNVEIQIIESKREVKAVKCFDCAASEGGCKHAVAFLMWLHRRSEEPSPTETVCYWKKATLSKVLSDKRIIKTTDFGTVQEVDDDEQLSSQFVNLVLEEGRKKCDGQIFRNFGSLPPLYQMSVHYLIIESTKIEFPPTYETFTRTFEAHVTDEMILEASMNTVEQSEESLWHELRYGRITVSKLYDVVHAQTPKSHVEQILSMGKIPLKDAMVRGSKLEGEVFSETCKKLKLKFSRAGFKIFHEFPFMGASPDGINDEFVLEIKCPSTADAKRRYLKQNGQITAKYMGQVQAQMYAFSKKKALFCVADNNFENNRKFEYTIVDYDEGYMKNAIMVAKIFWVDHILPVLIKNTTL